MKNLKFTLQKKEGIFMVYVYQKRKYIVFDTIVYTLESWLVYLKTSLKQAFMHYLMCNQVLIENKQTFCINVLDLDRRFPLPRDFPQFWVSTSVPD